MGTRILTLVAAVIVCGGTPSEFSLKLEMESDSDTEIYIGQRVALNLTLGFPTQTSDATVVELITSVKPTIFALESVDTEGITVGKNLAFTENDWQTNIALDQAPDNKENGIVYNTRAVVNLGTVTNKNSASEDAESEVTIPFSAVHVSNEGVGAGEKAYLSAGMEYLDGTKIFIGQIPLTIRDAKELDKTPSFSMTPPSEIEVMTPIAATLTMGLPYPASDVVVSTTLMNGEADDLFVQEIVTTRVASAFNYSIPDPRAISITAYENCPLTNNLELSMGNLVNSASQTDDMDTSSYEIDVEFIFQVTKQTIVGSELNVAVGVMINSDEVFVTDFNMTVVNQTGGTVTLKSFKLNTPAEGSVSPGFEGRTNLTIETIPTSNTEYEISVTTKQDSGSGNALSVIAVNPVFYGSNIPCEIDHKDIDAEFTSSKSDGVMDKGIARFSVTNTGLVTNDTDTSKNTLALEVVVMMSPNAVKDERHTLAVSVNGLSEQEVTFSVGENQSYPDAVNNQLSLEETCPSGRFQSGSTASFRFKVVTQRDATPGPITLECPIPKNLTGSIFAFASASVISKGANVICLQLGPVEANLSDWDANSNEKDRAVIKIPLICNKQVVDNVTEDEFVIEIKVKIKDKQGILNSSESVPTVFGAGMKYSMTQIWVVSASILIDPRTDFGSVVVVSGLKIPSELMAGHSLQNAFLQWSTDGFTFHDIPLRGLTVMQDLSYWSVTLFRPLVTRYARVINTDGFCMSNITYQQTNDTPAMYGSKNGPLSEKLMLTLDDDASTCMSLPFTTDPETTPFLWVELKKSIFAMTEGSSFNVSLVGEGIQCNSSGPQITMVVYPKEASLSPFQGNKMICRYTGRKTMDYTKIQCNYNCACSGADQCSEMSLVMINSVGSGNYTLCDISVTDA